MDNAQKIWDRLIAAGLTAAGAAEQKQYRS